MEFFTCLLQCLSWAGVGVLQPIILCVNSEKKTDLSVNSSSVLGGLVGLKVSTPFAGEKQLASVTSGSQQASV